MRFFSAALALSATGLVSAKSVQNKYAREVPVPAPAETPIARLPQSHVVAERSSERKGANAKEPNFNLPAGLSSGGNVVIIWLNPGAGAETTTINDQVTITETVIVPGATAPAGKAPAAEAPAGKAPAAEAPAGKAPAAEAPAAEAPVASASATVGEGGTPAVGAAAATHSVSVGGPAGLVFTPDQIKANVGDMVIFTYYSQNHTATQSTFAEPCKPLAGGMDSGFIPNANNTVSPAPQVAMQVMVTDPLWFYCAQGPHCGKGMVFSINPTAEKTHAMFQAMAIAQNGKGATAPIVGGTPAATSAAAAPVDAAPAKSANPTLATESLALPVATAAPGTGVTEGTGRLENGACVCSVQCSMGSFPNLQAQGVGAVGGIGGSLPLGAAVRKRW